MPNSRFVSAGLLTQRDLDVIGSGLRRAFPLGDTKGYASLLLEIDHAEGGAALSATQAVGKRSARG